VRPRAKVTMESL